eukprot:RCo045139
MTCDGMLSLLYERRDRMPLVTTGGNLFASVESQSFFESPFLFLFRSWLALEFFLAWKAFVWTEIVICDLAFPVFLLPSNELAARLAFFGLKSDPASTPSLP